MAGTSPHMVLVVDDDREIRETLVEILEEEGCRSVGAPNGAEALSTLRERGVKPCLILLDLMMPVMDGFTFRAELSGDPALREIPVVIITAYRDAAESARAVQATGLLKKPIQLQALLDVVDAHCANRTPLPGQSPPTR